MLFMNGISYSNPDFTSYPTYLKPYSNHSNVFRLDWRLYEKKRTNAVLITKSGEIKEGVVSTALIMKRKKKFQNWPLRPKKLRNQRASFLNYFLIEHLGVIQNHPLVMLKWFILKPNKQVTSRRQSTVKNNNDEASPTESEIQNKETKSSQTTLERFVRNNVID